MLRDVRERLGDHEVRRALDCRRQAFAGRQLAPDARRHGTHPGDRAQGRHQAAVDQDRRRDPTHEVAQLREGLPCLLLALEDELPCGYRIGVDPLAGEPEIEREHHEALLGAIVEVALDPVQLARLDVDDRRATLLERRDLAPELATLRGADQSGDQSAVKRDDELRQGRGDRQQRRADDDANNDR